MESWIDIWIEYLIIDMNMESPPIINPASKPYLHASRSLKKVWFIKLEWTGKMVFLLCLSPAIVPQPCEPKPVVP